MTDFLVHDDVREDSFPADDGKIVVSESLRASLGRRKTWIVFRSSEGINYGADNVEWKNSHRNVVGYEDFGRAVLEKRNKKFDACAEGNDS